MAALASLVRELSYLALAGRDGVVAVLQMFMDESGTHDGSGVTLVAAYIAPADAWERWGYVWKRELGDSVSAYHAVDAAHLREEFEGWSNERVAELASRLCPTMKACGIGGQVMALDMAAVEQALTSRPDLRDVFGNAHVVCFYWAVRQIAQLMAQANTGNTLAIIHEQNDCQGEIDRAYLLLKRDSRFEHVISSIMFTDKHAYPPLQAADILAYEANKRLRNPSAAPRKAWLALGGDDFVADYSKRDMTSLVRDMDVLLDTSQPWYVGLST